MSQLSEVDVMALPSTVNGLLPRLAGRGRGVGAAAVGTGSAFPTDGYVLSFPSGGAGYASIYATDSYEQFSAEAWIKTTVTAKQSVLHISGDEGSVLKYVSIENDQIILSCGPLFNPPIQSTGDTLLTDGQWHHIAVVGARVTQNGKAPQTSHTQRTRQQVGTPLHVEVSFFKDGVLAGTSSYGDAGVGGTAYLGQGSGYGGAGFQGEMFGVRLWTVPLSPAAVAAGRYAVLTGTESGLVLAAAADRSTNQLFNLQDRSQTGPITGCTIAWAALPTLAPSVFSLTGAAADFVTIGDVPAVSSEAATWECWVLLNADQSATAQTLLLVNSPGTAPRLQYNGGQQLGFYWGDEGYVSTDTTVIADGDWHHVAVVFDQGTVTFFKDGVALADSFQLSVAQQSGTVLQVGAALGSTNALNGQMFDIRMWKVARTVAEISSLRYAVLRGDEPGLVALCNLAGADPAQPATMAPVDAVTGTVGSLNGAARVVPAETVPLQLLPTAVWTYPVSGLSPIGPLLGPLSVLSPENTNGETPGAAVHAVDLQTAATLWTYTTNSKTFSETVIPAACAVAGGVAYVGVQDASDSTKTYDYVQLHAIDATTGAPAWNAPAQFGGSAFLTRPVVAGSSVAVGVNSISGFAELVLIDAATGLQSTKITLPEQATATFMTDPVLSGPTAYLGVVTGSGSAIYALTTSPAPGNGQAPPQWTQQLPAGAMVTANCATDGVALIFPAGGDVLALDAATGQQLWSHHLSNAPVTAAPLILGDTVHVGSTDGVLYALDLVTGEELWRLDSQSPITTDLINEDGVLYFATQGDGINIPPAFVAVDTHSQGADAVSYPVADADTILSGQAASNGTVYFYGAQTVYAVNMGTAIREFDISTKLVVENYDTGGSTPVGNDTSYRVTIAIRDEYGIPRVKQAVKLWSTGALHLTNQANPISLDSDNPAWLETDASGSLTVAISAFDTGTPGGTPNLSCPPLLLWSNFMALEESIVIYPDQEQLTTLAGVGGSAPAGTRRTKIAASPTTRYLNQATGYDGTALIQPTYNNSDALTAIASAVRNTIGSTSPAQLGKPRLANQGTPRRYLTTSASVNAHYSAITTPSTNRTYQPGADPVFTVTLTGGTPTYKPGTYDPSPPTTGSHRTALAAWSDITDFVEKVVKGTETIVKLAWQFAENAVQTVLYTAESAFTLAITDFEDAVTVVAGFLKSVATDLTKVIQWLSALFDWDNILANHTYLKQAITNPGGPPGVLDQFQQWLTGPGSQAGQSTITTLKPQAAAAVSSTAAALNGQTVQTKQAGNNNATTVYNTGGRNNANQSTWLTQKVNENGGITAASAALHVQAVDPGGSLGAAVATFFTQVEAQLQSDFSDLPGKLQATLTSLRSNFTDPKAMLSTGLADLLIALTELGEDIFAFLGDLAADLLTLLGQIIAAALTQLNQTLPIPFVSDLYRSLTGAEMTFLDLMCLVGAIPATLILDAVTGSPTIPAAPAANQKPTTRIVASPRSEAEQILVGAAAFAIAEFDLVLDCLLLDLASSPGNPPQVITNASRIVWAVDFISFSMNMVGSYGWSTFDDHSWTFWGVQGVPTAFYFVILFIPLSEALQQLSDDDNFTFIADGFFAEFSLILSAVFARLWPNQFRDEPKAPGIVITANVFGALSGLIEPIAVDRQLIPLVLLGKLIFGTVSNVLSLTENIMSAVTS